jgi:hypothetical protein
VVGEDFWTVEGEPWTMAFVSSFRLFERFLRGEDVAPLLQEAREVGANGVRVFGAFDFGSPAVQRLYPLEHGPAYYDLLPAFFELLGGYGLYAQFTVFADTARSVPGVVQQQAHFLDVCEVLRDVPNVLLERVNENDAHENRVEAPLPKPVGICSSFGSNGAGNDPPGPFWDYADLHAERRGDFALSTTTVHFAINGYGSAFPGTRRATVNSEPPGFADMTQPGRRTSDPRVAYRMGLGCRWGAGGTAHSDCGVQSVLLSPTQRACVEQFLRGSAGLTAQDAARRRSCSGGRRRSRRSPGRGFGASCCDGLRSSRRRRSPRRLRSNSPSACTTTSTAAASTGRPTRCETPPTAWCGCCGRDAPAATSAGTCGAEGPDSQPESAVSVHRMWRTYYDEVLVPRGVTVDDPDTAAGVEWFRRSFYAGAASMLDLLMRVGPDDVTEDQGVEMLERLREELQTFGKGLS